MAKKVVWFAPGQSETDDVVRRWLARQGIDQKDVAGYSITRRSGDLPTIELTMYFDDTPEQPAERLKDPSRVSDLRHVVGEHGPELVPGVTTSPWTHVARDPLAHWRSPDAPSPPAQQIDVPTNEQG